jgi:hypothetical protein
MKNTNVLVFTPQPPVTLRGQSNHRTFSLAGAGVGTVVFLVIGLFPSLVYGGAATVQLASGLFGTSGPPHVGFIVLGIVLAVTLAGALFAALGAVAGASVGALTRASPVKR